MSRTFILVIFGREFLWKSTVYTAWPNRVIDVLITANSHVVHGPQIFRRRQRMLCVMTVTCVRTFCTCQDVQSVAYSGFHKGGLQPAHPSLPSFLPPSSPPSPSIHLPSQARSPHDCQNEEADRSRAPSPPLPSPPLRSRPLKSS